MFRNISHCHRMQSGAGHLEMTPHSVRSQRTLHQAQLLIIPPATTAYFQPRTPNSTSCRVLSSTFQG